MSVPKSRSLWPVLLVLLLAAAGIPAFAGEAAHLAGTVTDEAGSAVVGARITVSSSGAFSIRTAVTDSRGRFRIIALSSVRPLNILAEADGKMAVEHREFRIEPDRVNHLDIRLRNRGAYDVLVLMDGRVPYHQLALDGARSSLPGQVQLVEVGEAAPLTSRALLRALDEHPSAVLAIGEEAAQLARELVRDTPVFHVMVPDPLPEVMSSEMVCGLSLNGGFEGQVERLIELDPSVRRVGTVYDPSRLSHAVARFRRAAEAAGIDLVAAGIHDPYDLPRAIDDLAREDLDAFVVLMDPEVYTARNFAVVRRFAEEMDLILVVPDPSMAGPGKVFAFGPGFRESGAAAGRLLGMIVEGRLGPAEVGLIEPGGNETAAATAAPAPALRWTGAEGSEPPLVGAIARNHDERDTRDDIDRE